VKRAIEQVALFTIHVHGANTLKEQTVSHHAHDGVSEAERERADADVVTDDYRSILTELSLLTTVSVLLFGFLLTVTTRDGLSVAQDWLLFVALISIATATIVFVLPVAYHRVQYPYGDWEKFQVRSHGFITVGLPIFMIGFYASIALACWERFEWFSFIAAGAPIAFGGAIFLTRRQLS
jgi:Family of unknown function (DUF6328)